MIVFFWLWPLRLFAKHNNCYFYTLEHLIRYGGSVKWYEDDFWFGYHCTWIHNGVEYSYDMTRQQRKNFCLLRGTTYRYSMKVAFGKGDSLMKLRALLRQVKKSRSIEVKVINDLLPEMWVGVDTKSLTKELLHTTGGLDIETGVRLNHRKQLVPEKNLLP